MPKIEAEDGHGGKREEQDSPLPVAAFHCQYVMQRENSCEIVARPITKCASGESGEHQDERPHTAGLVPLQVSKCCSQYEEVCGRLVVHHATKVGVYQGYEFRFEGLSKNTTKGDIKLWGRVIFLPARDGGKNGVTLLMLTTSLAPELRGVDDVGEKGELPMILESFRFGRPASP